MPAPASVLTLIAIVGGAVFWMAKQIPASKTAMDMGRTGTFSEPGGWA